MKKILVASMHHESNSFNPIIAGYNDFVVTVGTEIFNQFKTNDSQTGVIQTFLEAGYEVVPTVSARAVPNGLVDHEFYMDMKNKILKIAKEEHEKAPFDAICLSLHGSMRVNDFGEVEGDLLQELKEILPDIPVFAALDMHTTMTQRMFDNCDGYVGYKYAPHTDCTETGVHAAQMTIKSLETGIIPASAWVRIPFLVAGEQSATNTQPMIDLIQNLRDTEQMDGVWAASFLMGFPWADNQDSSVATYVVADTKELAQEHAVRLSNLFWSKLHDFTFQTETYTEKEAIDIAFKAVKSGQTPTYLSDSGDNPTAGSSSDCTEFLRMLMGDARTSDLKNNIIYGGIYDPEATKACEGKVGEEITITFGAKFDSNTSSPITATGIVKSYIKNWSMGSWTSDLALFSSCGVDIVLAQEHIGFTSPTMYEDLGRIPSDTDIIVCKLGYLTPEHQALSKRSIMVLTKGSTNEALDTLPYHEIQRPIYPIDKDFDFDILENLKVK